MKTLSIRQPWASLIAHGFKDIENRTWRTTFRGPFLLHASQNLANDPRAEILAARHGLSLIDLPRGGIIGRCELIDCVESSNSLWFEGPYGFVLGDATPLKFLAFRGRLGFFEIPEHILVKKRKSDNAQRILNFRASST